MQVKGKRNYIFLTSKKDYINEVELKENINEYIRLEVNCDGLEIENELNFSKIYKDERFYPYNYIHYRFIYKNNIDKNRIRWQSS